MAAPSISCGAPFPTATQANVGTSQSLQTTTTTSISTGPPGASTSFFRTCSAPSPSGTCIPTLTSTVIPIPGNTSVVTIPWTITVDVPVTTLQTLFGSVCTTITPADPNSPTSPTNPPTDPTTTPPPPTTSPDTTGTTLPTNTFTRTSTASTTSSTSSSDTGLQTDNTVGKKSSNVGPIAGGVVGGIAALLLLGFLTFKYIKNRPSWTDIYDDDTHANSTGHYIKKQPPAGDKPYDYGQLSQQTAGLENGGTTLNTSGIENAGGDTSGAFSNAAGLQPNQPPPMHMRTPSLTPLLAGVAAAAAGATAGAAATSNSSRPSSSDSSSGLTSGQSSQGQGYSGPNNTAGNYPPSLQNFMQQQGYSGGTANYGPNSLGYSGPSQSAALAHNTSVGSAASGPSVYSNSSWGAGSSSTAYSPYNPNPANIIPVMAAGGLAGGMAAAGRMSQQQQQPPRQSVHAQHPQVQQLQQQAYEDPFNRSGSPVSIQEGRVLQVTNADTSSMMADSSFTPYAEASSSSAAAGPSSSGRAQFAVASGSGAASSSGASSSTSGTRTDGKGRPINTAGEKAALVHLDGGAYQAPDPGTTQPPTGPAPPAYEA